MQMPYSYVILRRAQTELPDALEWYSKRSRRAASGLSEQVRIAHDLICANPHSWHSLHKDYRELPIRKYPYSIVYRIDEDIRTVVVISIFQHKRDPKHRFKG